MPIRSLLRRFLVREKNNSQASIWNETRGTLLADAADIADTGATRRRGLLKHDSLPAGQGLWILPCEAVHSCGMKFEIDVVYLNRKMQVRKLRKQMVPWRISACLTAHSALELPAGTIASTQTQKGDRLRATLKPRTVDRPKSVSLEA